MSFPKAITLLLLFFGVGTFPAPTWAEPPTFRVQIFSRHPGGEIQLRAREGMLWINTGDKTDGPQWTWPEGKLLRLQATPEGIRLKDLAPQVLKQVVLQASPQGVLEIRPEHSPRKTYSGKLWVSTRSGKLFLTLELSLEAYVEQVLASEMNPGFPMEALKAQAIVVRSYARSHSQRHLRDGFNFCDLTHCQVFGGIPGRRAAVLAATRQTRGMVLASRGKAIQALYHSTCGGHTAANQDVFGGKPLTYLQGVSDRDYCAASPHYRWESSLGLQELGSLLELGSADPPRQGLRNIYPQSRDPQGRIFAIDFQGEKLLRLRGQEFLEKVGRAWGWNRIKSNWFQVQVMQDQAHFKGRGLGHGVGLCQWGAKGMAESGKRFDEILNHYFPGTRIEHL